MAKKFFYVCAGMLCLSLAYHIGAERARAQTLGSNLVGSTGCSPGNVEPNMALVVDRVVYGATLNGSNEFQLHAPLPPIPGTSPVVSFDASCSDFAILANGDVWAGRSDMALRRQLDRRTDTSQLDIIRATEGSIPVASDAGGTRASSPGSSMRGSQMNW